MAHAVFFSTIVQFIPISPRPTCGVIFPSGVLPQLTAAVGCTRAIIKLGRLYFTDGPRTYWWYVLKCLVTWEPRYTYAVLARAKQMRLWRVLEATVVLYSRSADGPNFLTLFISSSHFSSRGLILIPPFLCSKINFLV